MRAFLSMRELQRRALFDWNGEPAGTRTQDPRLKRALLYQLSYELSPIAVCFESKGLPSDIYCRGSMRGPG